MSSARIAKGYARGAEESYIKHDDFLLLYKVEKVRTNPAFKAYVFLSLILPIMQIVSAIAIGWASFGWIADSFLIVVPIYFIWFLIRIFQYGPTNNKLLGIILINFYLFLSYQPPLITAIQWLKFNLVRSEVEACFKHAVPVGRVGSIAVCERHDHYRLGTIDTIIFDSTGQIASDPNSRSPAWYLAAKNLSDYAPIETRKSEVKLITKNIYYVVFDL